MTTYSRKRSLPLEFGSVPVPGPPLSVIPQGTVNPPVNRTRNAPKTKKPRLTQLTIDLGGNPRKTCETCRMEYVPSNSEDALLHKQFHNSRLRGFEINKANLKKATIVYECETRTSQKRDFSSLRPSREGLDRIIEVGRRSSLATRNMARKTLDVAERELGAVVTDDVALWSQVAMPDRGEYHVRQPADNSEATSTVTTRAESSYDRHKVYLYIQENRCVGLCLAERIRSGRRVVTTQNTALRVSEPMPLLAEEIATPATLGISRIWVSKDFRSAGIARILLDTVCRKFIPSATLDMAMVAFSQPTESGAKLARAWYGKDDGWLVYDEQHLRMIE